MYLVRYMKKYIKILLISVIIGIILAYFFYADINKEVRAITKKEEVVTLFQVGVFKDYNNAVDFSHTFSSSAIYKDNEYYRVIIALAYHDDVKTKLELLYTNKEINYYLKEIRVSKELINKISNFESILLKSNKEEVIDNVNNSILKLFLSNKVVN